MMTPIKHSFLALTIIALMSACASNSTTTFTCRNAPAGQYCIQKGDTLTRIAQRFRVSVADLQRWNNLSDDTIHAGQSLIVKSPEVKSPSSKITVGNANQTTNQVGNNQFSLQMPIQSGTIITPYSPENKGIDIGAERGTLVYASADGVVMHANHDANMPEYGKLLLIRHNNTTITAYANNQNILVPEGARVKMGQIIAEVGDTGRKDGRTALHFELRVNGKPVNPMNHMR